MPHIKGSLSAGEKDLFKRIGKVFRDIREDHGMSQRGAADEFGISQSGLSNMETGKRDIMLTTLIRWAKYYGYELKIEFVPIETEESNGEVAE